MKVLKYLMAIWAAVLVYSIFSLFFGATGFSAYNELLAGRELQWENIKTLGSINAKLENAQKSLLYDRDIITVHARHLGYGFENEEFMRIVGLGGNKNPYAQTGTIIKMYEPVFVSDKTIKLFALFTGTAVFCLLLAIGFLRRQ